MLDSWRDLTSRMYPNRPDLLARIPQANELTIAKIADGSWVMTDTCNTTRNYWRLIVESIKQIVEEEGIQKERMKVFQAGKMITNLYSIFFSNLTLHSCNFFTIILFFRLLATSTQCLVRICHHKARKASAGLDEDGSGADQFLSANHHIHHQSPACCLEVLWWQRQLRQRKGCWIHERDESLTSYGVSLRRLLGLCESCQDISVEGVIAIIMNVPYYLEFLIWRMRCGNRYGILERNLFMLLRSVKTIAFLCVLSILHIAVCMPLWWIADNYSKLSQHKFVVDDMASVVDIMDKAFYNVLIEWEKIVDEDLMMGICDGITKKMPPLQ